MKRTNDAAYDLLMSTPVPPRTGSYSPIPHAVFIHEIDRQLTASGQIQISGKRYYTNNLGTQVVGYTHCRNSAIATEGDFGLEMMIGYKNSYDKSMAGAIAMGANVMICGNGCVSGDMLTFKRKHTGDALREMREQIGEGISKLTEGFGIMVNELNMMKDFELTDKQKAEILGVMYFEEGLMTPTQLSIVKREMKTSEHFRGNTLWDVYNNVTEALKTSHPLHHIEDHMKLHNISKNIMDIEIMHEENAEINEG